LGRGTSTTHQAIPSYPIYQTMTEIATRLIRERVLSGHYKVGSRLIPAKLEAEIGLGRVAIREALCELAGSGMVVSMPNKGVIVADSPSFEEIGALYEARCVLEGEATYLATKNMTRTMIARLEALAVQMEDESQSLFDCILLNREFHLNLYKVSGWKAACQIINQLIDQTLIFRGQRPEWTLDPRAFHEDHRQIIEALKSGAADVAKRLVIANVSRGYQHIYSMHNQPTPQIKTQETSDHILFK